MQTHSEQHMDELHRENLATNTRPLLLPRERECCWKATPPSRHAGEFAPSHQRMPTGRFRRWAELLSAR